MNSQYEITPRDENMSSLDQPQRLKGRVAIVTGGSAGLGRCACLALAREGASVVVVGRDRKRLAEVADLIEGEYGGHAFWLQLDVTHEADMEEMAGKTLERFGRIDILIASAGVLRAPNLGMKTLMQTPVTAWETLINTNLKGTFLSMRAVLPHMVKQRSGDILTLSSKSGIKGLAFDSAYCASKFGVIGLTESVAQEVQPQGVRVQTLLPGTFDTELWAQNNVMSRPKDLPPPERVAEFIIWMVTLPRDTCVAAPLIEPAQTVPMPKWS